MARRAPVVACGAAKTSCGAGAGRPADAAMRLRDIGALLPYHRHVDPAVVVSALNRMVDDAAAGRTVFHDLHTAAEKAAEPSRRAWDSSSAAGHGSDPRGRTSAEGWIEDAVRLRAAHDVDRPAGPPEVPR